MRKTLAEHISTIDSIYQNKLTTKKEHFRSLFEDWQKSNTIVRSVMSGKTTFYDEYLKVFGTYESMKAPVPYLFQSSREEITDLEACIGYSELNNFFDQLFENPVGKGAVTSVLGGAFAYYLTSLENIRLRKGLTRRKFIGTMAGLFTMPGLIFGLLKSRHTSEKLDSMARNALYLDKIHGDTYRVK